jgi:tetratricopeptide (TPR) repeat protein
MDSNDLAGAVAAFERAAALTQAAADGDKRQRLGSRLNLAVARLRMGDATAAIAILQPLLPEYEKLLGAGSNQTLSARSKLAQAYAADGRYDEALATIDANLRAVGSGGEPRDRIEIGLVKTKFAIYAMRLDAARPLVAEATDYIAGEMPEPSFARGRMQWTIGEFHLQDGHCERAIPALDVALADAAATGSDEPNPAAAEAQDSLGRCHLQGGDVAAAQGLFEQAAATFAEAFGENHKRALRSRIHGLWAQALSSRDAGVVAKIEALRTPFVEAVGGEDKAVVWQFDLLVDRLARELGAPAVDAGRRIRAENGLTRLSGGGRVPPFVGLDSFS